MCLLTYPTSRCTLRRVYTCNHLSPTQFHEVLKQEVRINLARLSNKILFTARRNKETGRVTRAIAILIHLHHLLFHRHAGFLA